MKSSLLRQFLSISCLLMSWSFAGQALAQWYSNQPPPYYNQRYGDFPPRSIDEQLQANQDESRQPAPAAPSAPSAPDAAAKDRADTNPWRQDPRSAQQQPLPAYSAPGYGGYNRGRGYRPYGGSGPSFSGPWDNSGSGFSPWSRRGGWGGNRNPLGNRGMGDWFDPSKGSMSRNWDDALNAPSRMGEMPGGWTAPSVDVPNPVDVGDEFDDAARDLPDQMDNFNWNDNRRRSYR